MPTKKKVIDPELIIEKDFFMREVEFSDEEEEKLVALLANPNFRYFEKYLLRKQSRKAHAMVTAEDVDRMLELKAQIKGIGEITADMKILWMKAQRKMTSQQLKAPPFMDISA